MRIALASDAWAPQVNGVVRTLGTTATELGARGHDVVPLTPDLFRTVPCPSYPEIRLALGCGRGVAARLAAADPDAVHIATEGPIGWAARRWCLDNGMPFTTSFHTRFPDYVALRTRLPADWFWPLLRRFHGPAARVFAATARLEQELQGRGLARTHRWSRGVDLALFVPDGPTPATLADLPRPIMLHVGRVAVEKNIGAFLAVERPGTKVVVGDGPALVALRAAHPDVLFLGALHGADLAAAYRAADVLVFPSRTDTFGLVMVEALASGVPVAAFPVPGPLDVIGEGGTGLTGGTRPIGALDPLLDLAIDRALQADPEACADYGRGFSWAASTDQFLAGLCPRERASRSAPARVGAVPAPVAA
ncbi:glycosyltransferase family 4 protein [Sphingomonas montana]|uniref:glycosyltransferase family 4 protein n=1 Tax=Sphingomonas montana TaxID=1843236 RepID=UPI00096DE397|nr:glycosyltransferase family 1 protein [Sphingomonas montana]